MQELHNRQQPATSTARKCQSTSSTKSTQKHHNACSCPCLLLSSYSHEMTRTSIILDADFYRKTTSHATCRRSESDRDRDRRSQIALSVDCSHFVRRSLSLCPCIAQKRRKHSIRDGRKSSDLWRLIGLTVRLTPDVVR